MKKINKHLIKVLPFIVAILITAVYVFQAVQYTKTIEPVMDEGTYLLKGKWYWEDTFQPFEENGPLTNKPPFSFYILGLSQVLLKPGLASGRYFAVFLSVLLLLGQWLTVKKLAGSWWANLSISLYAISPAWIIYFSRAMTQVVTSLIVIWSLYFFLGKDRTRLQLLIGAILSAVIVMVRQNMLPFYLLTLLYILWENSWRKSALPILASLFAFLGMNIVYWPQIYQNIWQPLLPAFFNNLVSSILHFDLLTGDTGQSLLAYEYNAVYETQVFFDGIRYFFLPCMAALFSFILLFPKTLFKDKNYKGIAYLTISFLILTIMHFVYALYKNVLLYSFPAYYAFYIPIGVTLLPLIGKDILNIKSKARQWILGITIVAVCTGIGLSLYREIAPFFMNMNLPSINQRTLSGPYELWDVLLNQYHISIRTQEFIIPTVVGFLGGLLILLIAKLIHSIVHKKGKHSSYGGTLILVFFVLGYLLSPTFILSKNSSIPIHPGANIPEEFEQTAEQFKHVLPENAQVYWDGFTPIMFLYLPDTHVFPAQLNLEFYYRVNGDTIAIENHGFWNNEIAVRWMEEADILVFTEYTYQKRFATLDPDIQSRFSRLPVQINLDPFNKQDTAIILKPIERD